MQMLQSFQRLGHQRTVVVKRLSNSFVFLDPEPSIIIILYGLPVIHGHLGLRVIALSTVM